MADLPHDTIGKIVTPVCSDGVDFHVPHCDPAGDAQVDVLSSALPAGAATSVYQASIYQAIDRIADPVFQGDHLKQADEIISAIPGGWRVIVLYTVPAGKIAYVTDWGGSIFKANVLYGIQLRVAGAGFVTHYGTNGSTLFPRSCYGKLTAGQTVDVLGYHNEAGNEFMAAYVYLTEIAP